MLNWKIKQMWAKLFWIRKSHTVHFQVGCPPTPYVQTIIGCGMSSVAEKKLLGELSKKCKGKAPLKETKQHMQWHKNVCDTTKFLRNTKYERGRIYGR